MLYLTYDTNANSDGVGGQYQRIIGIIALAKKYNCEYVHTEITNMAHISDPEYIAKIDDYFNIKSKYKSVNDITYGITYNVGDITCEELMFYINIVLTESRVVLLKIRNPRVIMDSNTDIHNLVLPELRNMKRELLVPFFNKDTINVAIHIRRGDILKIDKGLRYTSLSYFEKIINYFIEKNPNINICIFTEIVEENKHEFLEIEKKLNVQIKADEDLIVTLEHLIGADILVMCKSSFSYLAGLYNSNTVLYENFWHNPLPQWKDNHLNCI